jgi:hypothetical protein
MKRDPDYEKLFQVPAPTRLDWISCGIALVLCAALVIFGPEIGDALSN